MKFSIPKAEREVLDLSEQELTEATKSKNGSKCDKKIFWYQGVCYYVIQEENPSLSIDGSTTIQWMWQVYPYS